MNNQNSIKDNKISLRRMFKQDIDLILASYSEYKKLFSDPITPVFINNILLEGEIWGAFSKEKLLGCCYYFPLKSNFYQKSPGYEILTDFINEPELYFCMGYVGYAQNDLPQCLKNDVYRTFLNISQMQAFRHGFKYVLHCAPVKLCGDISPVFKEKFVLIKLRGMEKLVVHYIFVKSVYSDCNIYEFDRTNTENISYSNTKILSKFLDKNYCATDILSCGNEKVFALCPLISY